LDLFELCKSQMPNLHKVLENGTSGKLKTVYPYLSGPAWTSILTGKKIANHGIINFFYYDEYFKLKIVSEDSLKEKRFYELLDKNANNCFIMDVPYASSKNITGDILESWISKNRDDDLIKPKSLVDKYPTIKQYQTFKKNIKDFKKIIMFNGNIIKEVIKSRDHDFMFFQISVMDWLQHKTLLDLKYNKNNSKVDLTKDIAKELDNLIGWIVDNMTDEQLMILSDHGIEEKTHTFMVNSWLKKQGYLITSKGGQILESVEDKKGFNININSLIDIVKRSRFLLNISKSPYRLIRKLPLNLVKQPKIDYENSKAVCLIKNVPLVKILEKDAVKKKKLIKELLIKLNSLTGIKAYEVKHFYDGKYTKDILTFGEIIIDLGKYELDIFVGDNIFLQGPTAFHSNWGIFAAYGSEIDNKNIKANVVDIAPTILHMFNMKVPADMDGKLLSIFKKSSNVAKRKVNFTKVSLEKEQIDLAIKKLDL